MSFWWLDYARYARPQWRVLSLICILMLAGIAVDLLMPWPLKLIIDTVLGGQSLPTALTWLMGLPGAARPQGLLAWLALATVGLFVLRNALTVLLTYSRTGAGNRMALSLAADVFDAIQRRSLLFHRSQRTGDLIRRIVADTGCVRELILDVYLPLLSALITVAGMCFVMWQLSPTLALAALGMAIPLGLVIKLLASPMSQRKFEEWEVQGEMSAIAEQTLSSLPAVQAFAREGVEDDRFRGIAQRSIHANLRSEISQHYFRVSTGAIASIGTAVVMVVGAHSALAGELSVGSLVVLLAYFAALYSPIETLAYLSEGFASASAGARRIDELLCVPDATICDAPAAAAFVRNNQSPGITVRLADVSFGYQAGVPAIRNISLQLEPGETVALVGPSGSGKSTLASMIPRLFDPWHGAVTFDGIDIRQLQVASVRAQVAIVPQEPWLLPLSVAENIAYARPAATGEEIRAAAIAAGAHGFIERLPQSYDTLIGERGLKLSGGERQRLSIARALLKDAPILILDEATAALDARSEASLVEALENLKRGRTTLVIAHRLSTIRRADRIVVLERGRIVETGTYEEVNLAGDDYQLLNDQAEPATAPVAKP